MNAASATSCNPFGVMDAPDPDAPDVDDFADRTALPGDADDVNATRWPGAGAAHGDSIAGAWGVRWNGGADPRIEGDAPEKWKAGRGKIEVVGERVFVLFDWNDGAGSALLDVRRVGAQGLRGRYINLNVPTITQPWTGLIVDDTRIDGRWPQGRLDLRR